MTDILRRSGAMPMMLAAAALMMSCDVPTATQKLSEQTLAEGDPPSASDISGGRALRRSDLAGDSWKIVFQDGLSTRGLPHWPRVWVAVALGTNGRYVAHCVEGRWCDDRIGGGGSWDVVDRELSIGELGGPGFEGTFANGVRIDAKTVCFDLDAQRCGAVLQKIR